LQENTRSGTVLPEKELSKNVPNELSRMLKDKFFLLND